MTVLNYYAIRSHEWPIGRISKSAIRVGPGNCSPSAHRICPPLAWAVRCKLLANACIAASRGRLVAVIGCSVLMVSVGQRPLPWGLVGISLSQAYPTNYLALSVDVINFIALLARGRRGGPKHSSLISRASPIERQLLEAPPVTQPRRGFYWADIVPRGP